MNRTSLLAICLLSLTASFHTGAFAAGQNDEQFPNPASSYRTEGLFPNVANLRNMSNGLSKPQVLDLLGTPHFSEGLFGVSEWNYIFNLRDADGSVTQCQYKVLYDDQAKVRRTLWNKPQCADLLKERQPQPVVAAQPEPVRALQFVALTEQLSFEFGRDDVASLSDDGRARLNRIVQETRGLSQVGRVRVVGYADRIGNTPANRALSESRAASVRSYLVANGVPAGQMQAEGRGIKTSKQCPGPKSAAVIQCLKGDRQVTIDVSGAR